MRGAALREADARRIAEVAREAMAMRRDASFEVVSIKARRGGDPAEARATADQVARTLAGAGARVRLGAETSIFLPANEVHVFLH